MKKQDFDFLKSRLLENPFLNDYHFIKLIDKTRTKIFFNDKVITVFEVGGFAYLVSWYCEGCISATQAKHINMICNEYNERF